jgi:hypothetical protein
LSPPTPAINSTTTQRLTREYKGAQIQTAW